MRRSTKGRRGRRGPAAADDLGDDLVVAATALIAERGPSGFSLREVARRAHVSEAAPYWHFADKEALLAAVAEQGFVGLAAAMTGVQERVKAPRQRLRELGIAYVRFALKHPSHLRIMFGPEISDKTAHPTLHAAAERAFGLLVHAVADAQQAGQLRTRVRTKRDAEVLAGRVANLLQIGLAPDRG